MINTFKVYIYKFCPTFLYYKIMYFVKKNRLERLNKFFFDKKNYQLITTSLKNAKKKNKFFILGSGPSINDLNHTNFREIQKCKSIGINKWIFHDFIADYYMIELKTNKYNSSQGFHKLNENYKEKILTLLKNKKKPIFLIHCPKYYLPEMQKWAKEVSSKRVFYYEYIRPNISKKNLLQEFTQTFKFISKSSTNSNILSLGISSSIERAISLGMILGFSKIILLGVDLKNREYFWNKKNINYKHLSKKQKGSGFHKTAIKKFNNLTIQRIISILDKIARKNFRSKILISTNKSLLSSKIKRYNWSH